MYGFSWGGSEELWYAVAKETLKNGFNVDIVVFTNSPIHNKLLELQKKTNLYFINNLTPLLPPLWKRIYFKVIGRPIEIRYANRFNFLKNIKYDCVLLSQGGATDIIYYEDLFNYFLQLETPFYILNHLVSESMFLNDIKRKQMRDLYTRSKQVFFVSDRNRSDFERRLILHLKNALILKNPVNVKRAGIIDWPQNEIAQMAVVARIDVNHKGHDLLLDVLSQQKWQVRRFKLNIYGTGPHLTYLQDLIDFYFLGNKVELKNHASNITGVWKENEILIVPSRTEGLPLTIVEAMLCGRPIVTTDVGDCAVMVEEGKTGWIAEAASFQHLDAALEKAWQARTQWRQAGIAAYEKAVKFVDPNPGKTLLSLMQVNLF